MMDFSEVEAFARRLETMVNVERVTDPILEKNGKLAGEWVNRLAPQRTRPRNTPEPYQQGSPGHVTFPPYLVGEYKGSSTRGPNRRFLRGALDKVKDPMVDDVAKSVLALFKRGF